MDRSKKYELKKKNPVNVFSSFLCSFDFFFSTHFFGKLRGFGYLLPDWLPGVVSKSTSGVTSRVTLGCARSQFFQISFAKFPKSLGIFQNFMDFFCFNSDRLEKENLITISSLLRPVGHIFEFGTIECCLSVIGIYKLFRIV